MVIGDLLEIMDWYKRVTWKGKIIIWFIILIWILGGVYLLFKEVDSAIELNNKYNITDNIKEVMHMQIITTTDASFLILALIVTILIAAIFCAFCSTYGYNKVRKFILLDDAYKKLDKDYNDLYKEYRALKGEYYLKVDDQVPSKPKRVEVKRGNQSLWERKKKDLISKEELYKLAHESDK